VYVAALTVFFSASRERQEGCLTRQKPPGFQERRSLGRHGRLEGELPD
jgi:hypothetical protein